MSNKLYRGLRQGNVAKVYVDNEEFSLEPSRVLHPSQAEPEFGYFGDGPSQTALAILYDATGDGENSLKYYQDFKFDFIANAHYDTGFTILQSQIIEWLELKIKASNEPPEGWLI